MLQSVAGLILTTRLHMYAASGMPTNPELLRTESLRRAHCFMG